MDTIARPLSGTEATAAAAVLREAVFGHLAMTEPDGPYVVPLNFVFVAGGTAPDEVTAAAGAQAGVASPARSAAAGLSGRVYFHTGEGRKTAALAADPRVCLAATAGVGFIQGDDPCGDAFCYRSVLVWGEARRIEDAAAREQALRAIVAKYDPAASGKPFDQAVFARTLLYELVIEAVSYKQEP